MGFPYFQIYSMPDWGQVKAAADMLKSARSELPRRNGRLAQSGNTSEVMGGTPHAADTYNDKIHMLDVLTAIGDGPATAWDIAHVLCRGQSSVVAQLAKARQMGLVRRGVVQNHVRTQFWLTDAGRLAVACQNIAAQTLDADFRPAVAENAGSLPAAKKQGSGRVVVQVRHEGKAGGGDPIMRVSLADGMGAV